MTSITIEQFYLIWGLMQCILCQTRLALPLGCHHQALIFNALPSVRIYMLTQGVYSLWHKITIATSVYIIIYKCLPVNNQH